MISNALILLFIYSLAVAATVIMAKAQLLFRSAERCGGLPQKRLKIKNPGHHPHRLAQRPPGLFGNSWRANPCRKFAMATPRRSLARAVGSDSNQNAISCDQ